MYCVYMMKCSLFSCGLFFFCVDFLLLFLLFVNISVEKQRPLLEPPHPSAILLMNWHTPKHLGLLFMHWPPLLPLYNFSADACTIHTVYNILKLVILALRPNLMLLQQPWCSASVVHHLSLSFFLSSVSSFLSKLMFDQSVSFSDQSFNSRGESPPKDCLCLHSGLHSYLCAKMSKKCKLWYKCSLL